jgi:hypothetical protein
MDVSKAFDKAWADKSASEILDAPVSALNGLSDGDAEKLASALGIRTVRDLATNKHFLRAHGLWLLGEHGR